MPLDSDTAFAALLDSLTPTTANKIPVLRAEEALSQRDQEQFDSKPYWHLIMIPPDQLPVHEKHEHYQTMRESINECQLTEDSSGDAGRVRFYIVYGSEGFMTLPPDPHFVHPDGRMIPFAVEQHKFRVASAGYSGEEAVRQRLEEPTPDSFDVDLDDSSYESEEPDDEATDAHWAAADRFEDDTDDSDDGISDHEPD